MDRPEAHLEASSRGKMCAILPADYVQFEPAANNCQEAAARTCRAVIGFQEAASLTSPGIS